MPNVRQERSLGMHFFARLTSNRPWTRFLSDPTMAEIHDEKESALTTRPSTSSSHTLHDDMENPTLRHEAGDDLLDTVGKTIQDDGAVTAEESTKITAASYPEQADHSQSERRQENPQDTGEPATKLKKSVSLTDQTNLLPVRQVCMEFKV